MEELKANLSEICELRDKLICAAKEAANQGLQSVNTHEMGEVTDMIKDLCEAEEKLAKACYYKKIVEAMDEEGEKEELMAKMGMGSEGRMGFDNWRYASGRFAPTGHGHRSGFRPNEELEPWMMAEGFGEDPWRDSMGYDNGSRNGSSRSDSNRGGQNGSSMGNSSRMGYSGTERGHRYDQYAKARMGYHESKDAAHKEHMDASAREYVVDVADTIKEMWKEADPSMKKEMKNRIVELTGMMN